MSSREEILRRVRASTKSVSEGRAADYASIPRAYRQAASLDAEARLDLFRERLHDYGVNTVCCAPDGVADAVALLLRERQVPGLLVPAGFPREWLPAGFDFVSAEGLSYHDIDASHGALTLCAAAIAITGTIILHDLAAGQGPKALSLIPDYHLCVVDAGQIVETVPEGLAAIGTAHPRAMTTISGPSATADIEITRVRGVHGPRTLEVLIRGC